MLKNLCFALLAVVFAWVLWGKAKEGAVPPASDLHQVSGTISFLSVDTARRSRKPHSITVYLDEGLTRTALVSFDVTLIDQLQLGQVVRGQAAAQNGRNVLWALETSSGLKRSFQDTVNLTKPENDRRSLFACAAAVFVLCAFGWAVLRRKAIAA